jgi:hypothetical protein
VQWAVCDSCWARDKLSHARSTKGAEILHSQGCGCTLRIENKTSNGDRVDNSVPALVTPEISKLFTTNCFCLCVSDMVGCQGVSSKDSM